MDGGNISGELASRIQSASGGAPLGGRTLARMESGFGASFAATATFMGTAIAVSFLITVVT